LAEEYYRSVGIDAPLDAVQRHSSGSWSIWVPSWDPFAPGGARRCRVRRIRLDRSRNGAEREGDSLLKYPPRPVAITTTPVGAASSSILPSCSTVWCPTVTIRSYSTSRIMRWLANCVRLHDGRRPGAEQRLAAPGTSTTLRLPAGLAQVADPSADRHSPPPPGADPAQVADPTGADRYSQAWYAGCLGSIVVSSLVASPCSPGNRQRARRAE
jgi:hypothetical protein